MSWIVKRKSDGAVLFETFSEKIVKALNREKYEAMPILDYLQDLNRQIAKLKERVPTK